MLLWLASSDGLLLEKLSCLLDTLEEEVKVNHVLLNLSHGQVDKHASDLGSVFIDKFLDEFENSASDGLLVVRVQLIDCAENGDSHTVELRGKLVI